MSLNRGEGEYSHIWALKRYVRPQISGMTLTWFLPVLDIGYRFWPFWSHIGYRSFGQVINSVGKISDFGLIKPTGFG